MAAYFMSVLAACSLVVGNNPVQCETDNDCEKFDGARCAADHLCKVIPENTAGSAGAAQSCSDTQECQAVLGSLSFCRTTDSTCVDLKNTPCNKTLGRFTDTNAVLLGALVPPTFGENQHHGQAIIQSLKMAVDEYNLVAPNEQLASPPIAIIVCDESSSTSISFLSEQIQPPLIIAHSNQDLIVAKQQPPPAVLGYSANTQRTQYQYSLSAPNQSHAEALGSVVTDVVIPTFGGKSIAPTIAIIGNKKNKDSADLLARTQQLFADQTLSVALVADGSRNADALASELVDISPNIIVLIGDETMVDIITKTESTWTAVDRPIYVLSEKLIVPRLYDSVNMKTVIPYGVLNRTIGIISGQPQSNLPALASYLTRFADFSDVLDPYSAGVFLAYDAAYLALYATSYVHRKQPNIPITGDVLSAAILSNQQSADTVNVGPEDRQIALETISKGQSVKLQGVSSSLTFDSSGQASPNLLVVCPNIESMSRFVESGLFYDSQTHAMAGALGEQCLR